MDSPSMHTTSMDSILLALALCSILSIYLFKFMSHKLPPGPWGLPLLGHLHLLQGKLPHEAFHNLSLKYGSIFRMRLGMLQCVIVSSSDLAKDILTTQDTNFASRPFFVAAHYLEYGSVGIASAPYGEHYRNIRKLCTTELFTSRCIDSFAWARDDALSSVLKVALDSSHRSEAVDLRDCISIAIFNSITQIVCSKKYYSENGMDPEAEEFKDLTRQIIDLILRPCWSNFVPWYLRWLDWQTPYYKKIQAKADQFVRKIIDQHRSTIRECKDFVDMSITHFGEGGQAEIYIKGLILTMLTAGTDTSIVTCEWLLAVMMHNPRVMKKVQNELDNVVGPSRMVTESDLSKLDYFQAVVKETMRHYPTVPMLMPRVSGASTVLGGYDIPKGTIMVVNSWALGMNASVWKDPSEFIPERFIGSSIDYKGQNFELLPFGSGRRKCPGMALAMRIVELLVANLVHGFDWEFDTETPPSKEAIFTTVSMLKTPLRAIPTPRLKR